MDFNMKKLITLALIVGAIALTQAQSNLVFNRVLNFTVSSSVSATVPEGKVWKVEHNSGDLRIDKAWRVSSILIVTRFSQIMQNF